MFRKILTSIFIAGLVGSSSALALTAQQKVDRVVTIINPDGTQDIRLEKADKMTPGDTVRYSIDYYNDDDKPAEQIVLMTAVPPQIEFFEGSADKTDVLTVYSADGGKSFAARDELVVIDAEGNQTPAQAAELTHIRWTILVPVDPDTGGTLSFSGRLK